MPRLILLRHASAEAAGPRMTDHERPLTRHGRQEAVEAGRVLAARAEAIDLVLASDSVRTRETWEGVATAVEASPKIRFLRSIFEADDYMPTLREHGGAAQAILLVGHNPAMHVTAVEVARSIAGRHGKRLSSGFPKGALAIFDFEGEWAALAPGRMQLLAFLQPGES